MNKPETIVSGIRASGRLHIGNYLGALKQFVELQADPDKRCFFFIADLHGLTTPFEPAELKDSTLQVAADYLAAGIDPSRCTFFLQNHVLEHATLAWVFNCILPLAELERMTQYKDKARQHKTNINAGLLTYPALMAADILAYKPTSVPVGEDQVQHVELARIVARKFNNRFGEMFPEPQVFLRKPLRIMSLTDPEKKMSKTGDEALLLDDTPEEIRRKLKKAVTASEPGKRSPGVDNLFLLLSHFGTQEQIAYFADQQQQGTLKFSELKETLADAIAVHLAPLREKKRELLQHPAEIAEILGEGSTKARQVAQTTLAEMKEKIGLL